MCACLPAHAPAAPINASAAAPTLQRRRPGGAAGHAGRQAGPGAGPGGAHRQAAAVPGRERAGGAAHGAAASPHHQLNRGLHRHPAALRRADQGSRDTRKQLAAAAGALAAGTGASRKGSLSTQGTPTFLRELQQPADRRRTQQPHVLHPAC